MEEKVILDVHETKLLEKCLDIASQYAFENGFPPDELTAINALGRLFQETEEIKITYPGEEE